MALKAGGMPALKHKALESCAQRRQRALGQRAGAGSWLC
jgi:hypothetical protein